MSAVAAYSFEVPKPVALAILWHGGRYGLSDYLCHYLVQEGDSWLLVFEAEHEAWPFKELLEEEGPLSCGAPELTDWLFSTAEQII